MTTEQEALRMADVWERRRRTKSIVRTVTVPDDWQSRDGVDWFPRFDEQAGIVRLHLHSDGSVSWSCEGDENGRSDHA